MGELHLLILGQEPIQAGRFGCDFAWTADMSDRTENQYIAYYQCPHRWLPGSDASYAAWQAGDIEER